jgi:hypothetical protein
MDKVSYGGLLNYTPNFPSIDSVLAAIAPWKRTAHTFILNNKLKFILIASVAIIYTLTKQNKNKNKQTNKNKTIQTKIDNNHYGNSIDSHIIEQSLTKIFSTPNKMPTLQLPLFVAQEQYLVQ